MLSILGIVQGTKIENENGTWVVFVDREVAKAYAKATDAKIQKLRLSGIGWTYWVVA